MPKEQKIYHAAELFNLPARVFNEKLIESLEKNDIVAFSPQRDGFEFSQLVAAISPLIPPQALDQAMQTIIYSYDVFSISKSDVVIARFDEPPDPGVDTEVLIANALGIPVVAYRTDVRSPYGSSSSKYGGMHSFPVKNSNEIIIQSSSTSPTKDFKVLAEEIVKKIKNSPSKKEARIPTFLKPTFKLAELLFEGIKDVHDKEGLGELARRCVKYKKELASFGPNPLKI